MDKYCKANRSLWIASKKRCSILLLLLCLFSNSVLIANSRYGSQNRYKKSLTLNASTSVYQIKMLNAENSIEQKFMESALRFSLGKYFSEGIKIDLSYIHGLNSIGPLFDNSESSAKYIRIYNTRLLLANLSYDYYINRKSFLCPKLGLGRMVYNEFYNGSIEKYVNQTNDTEFINIGLNYNYVLFDNFSFQASSDFFIGKQHVKFPMFSIGFSYFIPHNTLYKIYRNCPSFL